MLTIPFIFICAGAAADFGRPTLVKLAGGSCSGKTYLAERLIGALGPDRASLLSIDNYYFPYDDTARYVRDGLTNFDHPDVIDFDRLNEDVRRLLAGQDLTLTEAVYGPNGDTTREIPVRSRPFVIVEGMHALNVRWDRPADLALYIDADYNLRRARRLARDVPKGYSVAEVESYFDQVVEPMHVRYVQPTAIRAHRVVRSADDPAEVARVMTTLREGLVEGRAVSSAILSRVYDQALGEALDRDENLFLMELGSAVADERGLIRWSEEIHHLLTRAALHPDESSALAAVLARHATQVGMNGEPGAPAPAGLLVALRRMGARRVLARRCESDLRYEP